MLGALPQGRLSDDSDIHGLKHPYSVSSDGLMVAKFAIQLRTNVHKRSLR